MRNELPGFVSGSVVQAHSVGKVHIHQHGASPQRLIPSQLPVLPSSFVGRDHELDALGEWRAEVVGQSLLVVLTGPGGVGKTSLALRWLHDLGHDCPDGQLFANLGSDGFAEPVTPADVLGWFLEALGVAAGQVPVGQGQREVLYRSLTSSRRLVVLLDNAVSAAQVRPLLPTGSGSVVAVTSRTRLSGLAMDGARWLDIGALDESGSLSLLRRMVGTRRVSEETGAARELVKLCGGLPLALAVVAARLSTRPRRRLEREVGELNVERRRLSVLSLDGDVSVETVLDASYEALDGDARLLYRCCAGHPGREFGADVLAAGADWGIDRTVAALDQLVDANLLIEVDDRRFMFHDLIRLHARRRVEVEDSSDHRAAVTRRVVEWYLDRTVRADVVIHPLRPRLGPRYAGVAGVDDAFTDERAALAWLETERSNLLTLSGVARERGWHELVWQLCEAMWGFFLHTRRYREWIELHEAGIDSAKRCVDRRAEARLRSQLGFAYAKLRRYSEAIAENSEALRLAEAGGDDQARATALSQLGRAARGTGDLPAALRYFHASMDIQGELGQVRGVALCRRRIGDILTRLGRHGEAVDELRAAAEAMNDLGDRTQYARTLMFLGASHLRAERADRAEAVLLEALSIMREFGSPFYVAEILAQLGEMAEHHGDVDAARARYQEARTLYAAAEDPTAEVMLSRLAALG